MSATRPSLAANVVDIIRKKDSSCTHNVKNKLLLPSEWVYYIPGQFCDDHLPDSTTPVTGNHLWNSAEIIIPLANKVTNKGHNIARAVTVLAPLLQHSGMAAIKIWAPTESPTDESLAGIHLFIPHEFYPDGRVAYKLSQRYLKHFLLTLLKKLVDADIELDPTQSDSASIVEYLTIGGDTDGQSFGLPYRSGSIKNLPVHPCSEFSITDANLRSYCMLDDSFNRSLDIETHAIALMSDFFPVADFCYAAQTPATRNSLTSRQNEVKRLLMAAHEKQSDEVILKIQSLYKQSLDGNFHQHQLALETSAAEQINLILANILALDRKVSAFGGKQVNYQGKKYRLPTHAAKMLEIVQHHTARKIAASRTLEAVLACAKHATSNNQSQKLFARREQVTESFYTACAQIRPGIDALLNKVKSNPLNIISKKQLIELVKTYQREFNYGENSERMKAGRLKLLFGGMTQGIKDLIEFLNSDSVQHLDDDAYINGTHLFRLLDILRERETRTYGTLSGYDLNPDKATNVIYQEIYRILQEGCHQAARVNPAQRDLAAVQDVLMQRRSNKTYFHLSTNAKRGYPDATYAFALALLEGKAQEVGVANSAVIIRKNPTKALKLLQRAADAGHADAKTKLAELRATIHNAAPSSADTIPSYTPGP